MTTVAVVGGGITGLAAARRLLDAGLSVTVLEASPRWGGKLAPLWLDDVRLDAGAESILARRPEGQALLDDLGLAEQVVHPTAARPALLVGGELRRMPRSVLGVPANSETWRGCCPQMAIGGPRRSLLCPHRGSPTTSPSAPSWTSASARR